MESTARDQGQLEYLGALLEEERRLLLVPMNPSEPWAAFRQLRRLMRRSPAPKRIDVDLFRAGTPAATAAPAASEPTVVSLDAYRKRRS